MHEISLITTIAFGFTAALFFGLLAKRFGLSPILGYLIAGIAAGPHTPGFVGDATLSAQLAEIGVILLMFGVGLHFHWEDLLAVRSIAIPGALGQSLIAALATAALGHALGWTWAQGFVLGIAIAVASTVVLLRVLMDHQSLDTPAGHVAVGWLIVEDVITVLVLVMLPAFAVGPEAGEQSWMTLLRAAGLSIVKLVALVAVVVIVGSRFVPWLLLRVARFRSPELFTLSVLVMSIAVATASYAAFGVSMALGAFLAGMLVGGSKFSHQAGAEMLPLRDAFAVLFFVSVGMLFDYRAVLETPWLALGVVGIILIVKPLVAFVIVIARRDSLKTALTVAGGLSQIGEFSFILADVATSKGLLPAEGRAPLVLGAIVSICANPFLFKGLLALEKPLLGTSWGKKWLSAGEKRVQKGASSAALLPREASAIVIGYGPVGRSVTELLAESGIESLVIEMNIDTVAGLHALNRRALYGDATRRDILESAQIDRAGFLVITLPDPTTQLAIITTARQLQADLKIITRARYMTECDALRRAGADIVCCDEIGAAGEIAQTLLEELDLSTTEVERKLREVRTSLPEGI